MLQIVSKSKFKTLALEYFREIEKYKQPVVITHNGKPVAKVIPYKEESDPEAVLKSLRGTVLKYEDPTEPATDPADWEVLR